MMKCKTKSSRLRKRRKLFNADKYMKIKVEVIEASPDKPDLLGFTQTLDNPFWECYAISNSSPIHLITSNMPDEILESIRKIITDYQRKLFNEREIKK